MASRNLLGALVVCLPCAASADIMHWFWTAEVNGETVDASSPVVVQSGDLLELELRAHFDPYGAGFAAAVFAIRAEDSLFLSGDVNIDPVDGYGLNPDLLALGQNGTIADADSNGGLDTIDSIVGFQLARGWGGNFDPSEPIRVYRLAWAVNDAPTSSIRILHGPTLDGELSGSVYLDDFGTAAEYPMTSDTLVIVPAPSVVLVGAAATCRRVRGRRMGERSRAQTSQCTANGR